MVIMLSWTTVILCNLTANLHFSGKMTKGKCCVFPIDFFFPFPFADGDHVDFCQFKKAGLNKSTEILIPWAGLSSQWQWPHWTCTVLTSHCSCFIFGNLMLSSDFRGSRSGKACSAVLDTSKPQRTLGCYSFGKRYPERFLMESFLGLKLRVIQ